MIELGSNWAYYSLVFVALARIAKLDVKVTMLEPWLNAMRAGQNNFALNGMCAPDANATQVDAVWHHGMVCAAKEQQSVRMQEFKALSKEIEGVARACTSVTQIMVARGLQHVDVLLADLQGAELQALRGTPLDRVSHVWLGTHAKAIHQEALSMLRAKGFLIEFQMPPHDPTLGTDDGYIHAIRS